MPCFSPLKAWRSATLNEAGKRPLVFDRAAAFVDLPVTLPCGQCIGCRLERSRQWAIRCAHEACMHEENAFITLTYSDENLPSNGSLNLRHYQLFMKRLRKSSQTPIRFFHCGEYGTKYGRPHYHACLFGYDFPDKTLFKYSNGLPIYRSNLLEGLWPHGYSTTAAVTFQSAAYVARYLLKKITGDQAEAHYEHIDPDTGEVTQIKPEYTTMSRRPGLGRSWLDKYLSDVYPWDEVIMNGQKMRPPKYYDQQYEVFSPREHAQLKAQRIRNGKQHLDDNTPERLHVRCTVLNSKLTFLPRKVE